MTRRSTPTRRARGTATRERLLDAAETLLAERMFEQIAIQDIVAAAGSTVGSFYNLFPDKNALLPALYERSCGRTLASLDELLQPARWRDATLSDVVGEIVAAVVGLYQKERGLMRALVLRSHCRMGDASADRPPAMDQVIPRVAALIARFRDEIAHPQPKRAAAFGFSTVLATAREHLLYPQTTAYAVGIGERAMKRELTRVYLSYLRGDHA